MTLQPPLRAASLFRRLASGIYELLVLAAVVFIATLPFSYLFGDATHGWKRHLLQGYVVVVMAAYFTWFWTRGGQTLPMKTWRFRVVRADGAPLSAGRALHRFALAVLGFLSLGLGFLWALVDRDGQFLHDRLAGTALVDAPPPPRPA